MAPDALSFAQVGTKSGPTRSCTAEVPSCAACSMTTAAARRLSEGGRTYWPSKEVLTYLHSKSLILSNATVTSPRALMAKWNTALKVRSSSGSDSPWRIK